MGTEKPVGILATPYMADIAQRVQGLIPQELPTEYIPISVKQFPSGEIKLKIDGNVRYRDIYIFHSMSHPDPNTGTLAAMFAADAAVGASARNITMVLPYFCYLRQDRKDEPRTAISARRVIRSIEIAPNISFMMVDMHAQQMQSVFNNPVDEIPGWLPFVPYFQREHSDHLDDIVLVGSDSSALRRVEELSAAINVKQTGYIQKVRNPRTGKAKAVAYIGPPLKGKIAISVDDMIDTAGTQEEAARFLSDAKEMVSIAPHGIFSTKGETTALDRLERLGMKAVVTNSYPHPAELLEKYKDILTVVPLEQTFADAIHRSMTDKSVSAMWTRKENNGS